MVEEEKGKDDTRLAEEGRVKSESEVALVGIWEFCGSYFVRPSKLIL